MEHMQNSVTKATLLSGAAFIRPTAAERLTGRLMRAPDGHEGTPAPSPAPAPAPTPAPSPTPTPAPSATEGAEGGEGDDSEAERSALDGGDDDVDTETQPETKTPEEIAAEEAAAKAAEVPETYELTAPEGMTLDDEAVTFATPIFKELGLSNEEANKLMPAAAQLVQRTQAQMTQQLDAQVAQVRKEWLDTARADPEIGGAKWKESLAAGAKALDLLGFPKGSAFRTVLNETGFGNHPEMIRAFAKVGAAIGDDPQFLRNNGALQPKRDRAETLYPDDTPEGG
jgi:hypothetical protein